MWCDSRSAFVDRRRFLVIPGRSPSPLACLGVARAESGFAVVRGDGTCALERCERFLNLFPGVAIIKGRPGTLDTRDS